MVKTVVFDLGKVLVDFDYEIAARSIGSRTKLTPLEINEFMMHSPLLVRYEMGLLTSEEFYKEVCSASGYAGTLDEFGGCFGDIFSPIEPMVQLQAALRQRGIPTYIFSNTNDLAIRHIRRNFPFFTDFNGYILSYEHRAMKPDAKLYEVVEKTSGRRGPEILYLDDRSENIAAGAARGWQVILHETAEKTRTTIDRLGVLNHAPR